MGWTIRQILVVIFGIFSLTACFVSETQLIPAGSGELPIDGATWIGTDDFDRVDPNGDGYFEAGHSDSSETIRFHPLKIVSGKQYYVAELSGYSGEFIMYGVARRIDHPTNDERAIQIAIMDCGMLDNSLHEEMTQEGWRITASDSVWCATPSLDALTSFLSNYLTAEILENDTWWESDQH